MRKVIEAKQKNKKVVLWGDGSPLREFTYSDDVARILLMLLESDIDFVTPLNIGNVGERSIKQIAEIICDAMDLNTKTSSGISRSLLVNIENQAQTKTLHTLFQILLTQIYHQQLKKRVNG